MTRWNRSRKGLSLLEVIVSVAILGASLAILGQLVYVGARAAREADVRVIAQLHCESIMNEIVSGLRSPDMVVDVPFEIPDPKHQWVYSILVESTTLEGMLAVQVVVRDAQSNARRPIEFRMARWIIDPDYLAEQQAAQESAADATGT